MCQPSGKVMQEKDLPIGWQLDLGTSIWAPDAAPAIRAEIDR
jgi:hypothetical protein